MISGSGLCSSFKVELFEGIHNFTSDAFFIALYTDSAPLSPDTTAYLTDGEVSGPGYAAGGIALENVQVLGPALSTAYVTWDDPIWPDSILIARAALVYNQSKAQRAVCVLDFLTDQYSITGDFRVKFPPPGPTTALIRLQ